MRVALATDHAGLPLKAPIAAWLAGAGHEVVDFGVDRPEPVDYPDIIAPAARAVAAGDCSLGIVLGGSGSGEQIVANKIRGVRCVQATEPVTARLGRAHNDANVLALGARIVGSEVAVACVAAF
ncbi:MAG TPA: RpiB/LacA/LacB family sugar-phosphate isomerase, partial [Candidatus Limnocylindria bacterium]|nr:RpiB/LacA/LacB family sugar-phosphate isomerase [Candidatus Limnocylindria bacterium]